MCARCVLSKVIKQFKMFFMLMVVLFVWAVGFGCSWCLWRGKNLRVGNVSSGTDFMSLLSGSC